MDGERQLCSFMFVLDPLVSSPCFSPNTDISTGGTNELEVLFEPFRFQMPDHIDHKYRRTRIA